MDSAPFSPLSVSDQSDHRTASTPRTTQIIILELVSSKLHANFSLFDSDSTKLCSSVYFHVSSSPENSSQCQWLHRGSWDAATFNLHHVEWIEVPRGHRVTLYSRFGHEDSERLIEFGSGASPCLDLVRCRRVHRIVVAEVAGNVPCLNVGECVELCLNDTCHSLPSGQYQWNHEADFGAWQLSLGMLSVVVDVLARKVILPAIEPRHLQPIISFRVIRLLDLAFLSDSRTDHFMLSSTFSFLATDQQIFLSPAPLPIYRDVTLVSQLSVSRLPRLLQAVNRWHGAISVAIFLRQPTDLLVYLDHRSRHSVSAWSLIFRYSGCVIF